MFKPLILTNPEINKGISFVLYISSFFLQGLFKGSDRQCMVVELRLQYRRKFF